MSKATEGIVCESLRKTYSNFNEDEDASLVSQLVTILSDDTKQSAPSIGFESHAAYEARMLLLRSKPGGVASVKATVSIFEQLGRANELSWLKENSD